MTPSQQKAYYEKNKADAKVKEDKALYEIMGSRGDAVRKGMEEGRMDAMGTSYKKGGKVMKKKMKKYEDGGEIEFETKQGKNSSIGDDVRERAMKAISEGGQKTETPKVSAPKVKASPKKETKLSMPDYSNEDLDRMGMNEDLKSFKKANMNDMPENLRAPSYKAPSVVKMVSKEVTKPTPRSPSQMIKEESEYAMKPNLQSKGERLMKMFGMKAGGKVKSASARADGCAIRGKTRA